MYGCVFTFNPPPPPPKFSASYCYRFGLILFDQVIKWYYSSILSDLLLVSAMILWNNILTFFSCFSVTYHVIWDGRFSLRVTINSNQYFFLFQADQNRISRNQVPLYCVQGRFERINQHPVMSSSCFAS